MDAIDYEKVANIYQQGIDSKQCTFETEVPTWDSFDQGHLQHPRLVAVDEQGEVCGFIVLSLMSSRRCFRGVAEISIYLDGAYTGQGIGRTLMNEMITQSEEAGIWSLFLEFFQKIKQVLHFINDVVFEKLVIVRKWEKARMVLFEMLSFLSVEVRSLGRG